MNSQLLLAAYSTTIILLVCKATAAPSQKYLKTPSGKLIPTHRVLAFLPEQAHAEPIEHRIRELTQDFTLLSHNSQDNLNGYLGPAQRLSDDNAITYINNRRSNEKSIAFIRRGSGYSLVTDASNSIVSLQVPGNILKPIDLSAYPGVFISVHENSDVIEFGPDMVPPILPSESYSPSPKPSGLFSVAQVEPSCMGKDAPPQYVELAVAIDSAMCAKHGNSASKVKAAVLGMISDAEEVYKQKMCIRFVVNVFDIVCDSSKDAYMNLESPLADFKTIWASRPASSVDRALAILITGNNYLGGVAGQAYTGVTCIQSFSFAWMDNLYHLVFTHEVGHNLNAAHEVDGVMKGGLNLATDTYFSDVSVTQIVDFVNSETIRSSCIKMREQDTPVSNPAPQTCESALSKWESVSCVNSGASWRTRVGVSTDGFSGKAVIGMQLTQQYGIAVKATAPQKVVITKDGSRRTLQAQIVSIKVAASFERVGKRRVNSEKTRTVRDGLSLTGFEYPGDVSVPSGISTCCGSQLYVHALLKMRVYDGNGFDRTYGKLIRRTWEVQCSAFPSCGGGFTAASDSTACPICKA